MSEQTMSAAVVSAFGGPEQVVLAEVPIPRPAAGQLRVRVAAAGLNPVDGAVRAGVFGGGGQRLGLGWEVAGEIDEVGADVTGLRAGDRVVGLHHGAVKPLGTHAQYVVLDATAVAAAPTTVDAVAAAGLPLGGLTAARAVDLLGRAPPAAVRLTRAPGRGGAGGRPLPPRGGRGGAA
ncbi:alcohol dehydrogenase catalytic domain-containing protein, partial [Streptomyces sp. NPDC059538]|uniref:alcohol dehydrogenase catalytic domain-containing protein n=1 Tax=Streptomyces sp. NPDC059538 TaxID=3346860 RepID=UPI0036CA91B3